MTDPIALGISTGAVYGSLQSDRSLRTDVLSAVAASLKTTTPELQTKLSSGQSLTQVAQAAGVSRDQLVSTISTVLSSAKNVPATADVGRLAERIADSARVRQAPVAGTTSQAVHHPRHRTGVDLKM